MPAGAVATASEWYVVRPGDDLWSIAAATVAARGGHDTGSYWLAVIAQNRRRLPDPADPSLLFPGDEILLPPGR